MAAVAGGLALVWIAYKLLVPSAEGDEHGPAAAIANADAIINPL